MAIVYPLTPTCWRHTMYYDYQCMSNPQQYLLVPILSRIPASLFSFVLDSQSPLFREIDVHKRRTE